MTFLTSCRDGYRTVPHLIRFKCDRCGGGFKTIRQHTPPTPIVRRIREFNLRALASARRSSSFSAVTISDFSRLSCVNMSARVGGDDDDAGGGNSSSLAVRFKLLLVVALHHIILATIGDNKICCTPAHTHTQWKTDIADAAGWRERFVSGEFASCWQCFFFVCHHTRRFRAALDGGGLLKNHYANNIHTPERAGARRSCCRFVGASEWRLNWSLLCSGGSNWGGWLCRRRWWWPGVRR